MKLFYFISLLLSFGPANAQVSQSNLKTSADDNTLLWEVSGNGLKAPSYLFGTFHLLCKEDIHFSNAFKQALAASSKVYLELDLDDPATLFGGIMLMNMKDGKKLKDLYAPEAYQRLVSYFKDSLQTPISMFQGMKPDFLVALLYPKMMPCDGVTSIEDEIMKLAKTNNTEIKGLETMAFQASLFDSIPYEKQAEELLKTIDSMENARINFGRMLNAYKNQQLNELETLLNDPEFGMEDNQDILLNNRNKNWVKQLKEIMKAQPVFTAVGTGHLVGKAGLITLLRAEGFTLRGLENKN